MKIIIQAVEERRAGVDYLLERLPGAVVVWDEKRHPMHTFLRALTEAGEGPALHLEDDVILTRDFLKKLTAALALVPPSPVTGKMPLVQFFSMRKADIDTGSRWDRQFMGNLCWYSPPGLDREFRAFFPTWRAKDHREKSVGYDTMMRAMLRKLGEPYWIHCPNLVQHRVGKSAIDPRRSSGRLSRTFGDPDL